MTTIHDLIAASRMADADKQHLRDVLRVVDGGGTMREAREHAGLSLGQAAKVLHTTRDHLRAVENGEARDDLLVRRMMAAYDAKGFTDA